VRGPLHGIPVLLSDVVDVKGHPTTGGSIALQNAKAARHATLVTKLEEAGAVILGKANVTELNGLVDANLPEGYSSLGGQVLLPSDTDKTVAGSSAGAAAATAAGLAAFTIGLETSTDSAQLIAPAGVAGVVAIKPTVGLVSRSGVLPAARSQDSPGPITRTVFDAAAVLEVIAGYDPADAGSSPSIIAPDYLSGLVPTALAGKRVVVTDFATAPYPTVVTTLQALGATTVVKAIGTPSPNPPSIVLRELERDLDAYLLGLKIPKGQPKTLAEIVAYNAANPVEGLKYQQRELLDAIAVDLSDEAQASAYAADKTTGAAGAAALIDTLLNNATPTDPTDDFEVIVVQSGHALVGVADRAGYPVLTVPAGFGTGNAGRNPIGVTFIAAAFEEASLLAAGYAFEQATNVRQAPSFTNPSMWRCVPGSDFFSPHHCHPGDLLAME
jgi:Asp-tRNA(Asn)/Glu-tRNA(Gln) amidotransferase A subunit family amidase